MVPGLGLSPEVLADRVVRQPSLLGSSLLQKTGSSRDPCRWQRLPAQGVPWDRDSCTPRSGEPLIFPAGPVCLRMGKLRQQQRSLRGSRSLIPPTGARGVCE